MKAGRVAIRFSQGPGLLPALSYVVTLIFTHLDPDEAGHHFFFFKGTLFIYLLAALGLRCCVQAFSSCSERGLLFVAVHGLLIALASLVAEHRL